MRIQFLMAGFVALLFAGPALALGANWNGSQTQSLGRVSLDTGSFSVPSQFGDDGTGVAARNPDLVGTSYYFPSQPFVSVAPFAFAGEGPLGHFAVSGYAVDTLAPRLPPGEFLTQDRNHYTVRDLKFSSELTDGVTINAGYNLDLEGRFDGYDLQTPNTYDGLFLSGSALNSRAMTSMVGVGWDFARWGGLGLTASNTVERHGLLGDLNSGALAIADGANTSAVGLNAHVGFGNGWVTTVSYSEGITQLDLRANGLAASADTLHSRTYGIAIAKHGLFADNDSLGLAISRPIHVYSGAIGLTAGGIDDYGNILTGTEHVSLVSGTPETDFEMGYVTTFLDGAVALQANAAWQQNLAGQSGVNSLAVLSRAKINF